MLLHNWNLDHLLDVGVYNVSVAVVDVPGQSGQGEECLAAQPAGQGLGGAGGTVQQVGDGVGGVSA